MANTYGSAHFHLIFATKNRTPWIVPVWRHRLHAWLAGAIARSGAVPVEVGGVGDHVHLLAGLRPSHRLADLLLDWKRGSSRWVHDDCGVRAFAWQDGYSYFAMRQCRFYSGLRPALPLVAAPSSVQRRKSTRHWLPMPCALM